MTLGFLGLGAMGARMAERLVRAGYEVAVYNRTAARAAPLAALGARVAATPREAAEGAAAVIAVVRDDAASREVWLRPEVGALAGLAPGAAAIESSTVTPDHVLALARATAAAGGVFLDAPVVGTRPHAEAGTLTFLVGGELPPAAAALEALGRVVPCGPVGAGATLKLGVNGLLGIQVAAVAEILSALERAGVPRAHALEVLGATPVMSPTARLLGGLMIDGRHAPLFPIALLEKDLGYLAALAADTPVTDRAREVCQRAIAAGYGELNMTAVARLFEPPQ